MTRIGVRSRTTALSRAMSGRHGWQPFLLLFIYKIRNNGVYINNVNPSPTPIFAPDSKGRRAAIVLSWSGGPPGRAFPLGRARVAGVAAVRGASLRTVEHVTQGHR